MPDCGQPGASGCDHGAVASAGEGQLLHSGSVTSVSGLLDGCGGCAGLLDGGARTMGGEWGGGMEIEVHVVIGSSRRIDTSGGKHQVLWVCQALCGL